MDTYLLLLALFFRCEKTFTNLLIFSVLGYLCYFTFNTGVHENHLFLVTILAVVLYWREESWRANAVILLLMANINLFLFYGVDGDLHFPRRFAGVDIALPLAILNVLFFIYLCGAVLASTFSRGPCVSYIRHRRGFLQLAQHIEARRIAANVAKLPDLLC